jgi:hypothetical protein
MMDQLIVREELDAPLPMTAHGTLLVLINLREAKS